jgi:hypothetical protein
MGYLGLVPSENTTGDDLPSAGIPVTSTRHHTTHTDGVYAIFRYIY